MSVPKDPFHTQFNILPLTGIFRQEGTDREGRTCVLIGHIESDIILARRRTKDGEPPVYEAPGHIQPLLAGEEPSLTIEQQAELAWNVIDAMERAAQLLRLIQGRLVPGMPFNLNRASGIKLEDFIADREEEARLFFLLGANVAWKDLEADLKARGYELEMQVTGPEGRIRLHLRQLAPV